MAALRDRKVVVMLGAIGMGKTVLTNWLIAQHRRAHPKAKIIALDRNRQFTFGEWPPDFSWSKKVQYEWVKQITNNGRGPPGPRVGKDGALVVLDDSDLYLSEFKSPWDEMWTSPRQLFLDLIASGHRTQGLPKELLNAASDLVLFWAGEVHGQEYLRKFIGPELVARIPQPAPGDDEGETVKGLALWVKPRSRVGRVVDVFQLAGINYKRPVYRGGKRVA